MIRQGDQYCIPIKIKQGDDFITPDNIRDLKIKIGSVEKVYSNEELYFDEDKNTWLFPVTQEMTLDLSINFPIQAQIYFGYETVSGNPYIVTSNVVRKNIGDSIIKTKWEGLVNEQ